MGIGDWGLGIGDWGLGIGPNPQSPIPIYKLNNKKNLIIKIKYYLNDKLINYFIINKIERYKKYKINFLLLFHSIIDHRKIIARITIKFIFFICFWQRNFSTFANIIRIFFIFFIIFIIYSYIIT